MGKSVSGQFLKKVPLFLLTIPLVFLINIANHYFHLLDWSYVLPQAPIYIGLPIVLYWILSRVWKSYSSAGVFMAISLIIFYFFSPAYDALQNQPALKFLGKYSVLLAGIAIGLIILFIWLFRHKGPFPRFYYITNLIFIFLLIGGVGQYILQSFGNTGNKLDQANSEKKLVQQFQPCDTCSKPDIYFLIFDGYTNTRTFKSEFNYDNSSIETKLRDRGFFIASNSKSNYNFTHMSIASELNMDYLYNLNTKKQFYTKDFFRSNYTIKHNEWVSILYKQGYSINNLSEFELQDAPVKTTPNLTELNWRSVWGQTFFHKLNRDIGWMLVRFYSKDKVSKPLARKIENDVKRIKETFNGVVDAVKHPDKKAQFVYGHFLVPHETYYFDSTGKRLPLLRTATTNINKEDYVMQSIYSNNFLMAPLVDSIFNYSSRPFIIIIQSDHGYRSYPAEKVMLEFENFNAFYFPDKDFSTLTDSISSVNTFRFVANKYFGQKMAILKDSMVNLYKSNSY